MMSWVERKREAREQKERAITNFDYSNYNITILLTITFLCCQYIIIYISSGFEEPLIKVVYLLYS